MYERFYGLSERPFDITTSPSVLVLTDTHREALSTLQYGLQVQKGITLLLGEAGMGKTMLLQHALTLRPPTGAPPPLFVCLNNPTLNRRELLSFLAGSWGLSQKAARCKTQFIREFESKLQEQRSLGGRSALIIDEAQSMPDELMEEVRLLANVEIAGERCLSIVLAGQLALAPRLKQPWLRQLKQRIGLRCLLAPLPLRESAAYILARIRAAGGNGVTLFSADAVRLIHARSGGIPRSLNIICDNALLTGLALGHQRVDAHVIREVCRELDIPEDQPEQQEANGRRFAFASLFRRGPLLGPAT